MARVLRDYDALWLTLLAWAIFVLFIRMYEYQARGSWIPPGVVLTIETPLFLYSGLRAMRWRRGAPMALVIMAASSVLGLLYVSATVFGWFMCCP